MRRRQPPGRSPARLWRSEALHPETTKGRAQSAGMNRAVGNDVADKLSVTYAEDQATKTGTALTLRPLSAMNRSRAGLG